MANEKFELGKVPADCCKSCAEACYNAGNQYRRYVSIGKTTNKELDVLVCPVCDYIEYPK